MKLRILKSLSLLLLAVSALRAQSAADFFHAGARQYLNTNYAEARQTVTNGLMRYHNDPKLTNLWELLNRNQQHNQRQQNKDQQSKDDQKGQQEQKQQEKQQQNKEQKPEDQQAGQQKQKEPQQASKPDQKQGDENKAQSTSKQDEKPGDQAEDAAQSQSAMKMTPEQAIRLLEAFKAEERNMPFRPPFKTNRHDRLFKDW